MTHKAIYYQRQPGQRPTATVCGIHKFRFSTYQINKTWLGVNCRNCLRTSPQRRAQQP